MQGSKTLICWPSVYGPNIGHPVDRKGWLWLPGTDGKGTLQRCFRPFVFRDQVSAWPLELSWQGFNCGSRSCGLTHFWHDLKDQTDRLSQWKMNIPSLQGGCWWFSALRFNLLLVMMVLYTTQICILNHRCSTAFQVGDLQSICLQPRAWLLEDILQRSE